MNKLWIESPFYKKRGSFPLDMIVIHHIGSSNGKLYGVPGTVTWFTDKSVHLNKETGKIENQVSAHYIVPRDLYKNNEVIHLVKDLDIAYHAGYSQWSVNGISREYINNYSIGIELEGDGNLVEYTDYQYDTLIKLVKELMAIYNISETNIVGHEYVAPGRKVDPGKLFDWKKLRTEVTKIVAPVPTPKEEPVDPPFFMESGEDKKGKPSFSLFRWLTKILLRK